MNRRVLKLRPLLSPQIIALLLILLLNWILFPGFFNISWQNGRFFGSLIDVLNRGAPVAILAVGMTTVIATKGVDLSVGAVMAVAGAAAATLATGGFPLPVILLTSLALGLLCGLWNGLLVAVLDIQPFVATLVLMVAGRGLAQLITEGHIVTFNDPALSFVGTGAFFGVPMAVIIALCLVVATHFALRRTAIGLFIEAIGTNRSAANYAGLKSQALLIAIYGFSGLCAGIAGLIVTADIKGADANNAGLWLELDAILAVVIGGTSLLGGRFSVVMSVVGAIIIQAMNTGILVSGLPPQFNLVVKAGVILAILILQSGQVKDIFSSTRKAATATSLDKP